MSEKTEEIEPIQNVVLKLQKASHKKHYSFKLNLYRMLYWNNYRGTKYELCEQKLNLYRMLYWNLLTSTHRPPKEYWTYTECCIEIEDTMTPIYAVDATIEPIQNVVLKYNCCKSKWCRCGIEPIQNVVLKFKL